MHDQGTNPEGTKKQIPDASVRIAEPSPRFSELPSVREEMLVLMCFLKQDGIGASLLNPSHAYSNIRSASPRHSIYCPILERAMSNGG